MNFRTGGITALAAIALFLGVTGRLPGMKDSPRTDGGGVLAAQRSPDAGSTPVLVELFTSEGCSSCPPADSLLMRLGRTQPVRGAGVIVLEEHVDYWDRLGWKDPFSSEAATTRQGDYGEAFGGRQIYTPQMVVDGHAEFVGSSEREALRAIRSAGETPKPAVHLAWSGGDMLSIDVEPLTNATHGDTHQVYLAVIENMLRSDVKRGENSGRALEHDGVARQLISIGKVDTGPTGFSGIVSVRTASGWNRANLRAVVFVQERRSRRVLAAMEIPFPVS
jgi:hypothetical protein